MKKISLARRIVNVGFSSLCLISICIGVVVLFSIFFALIWHGAAALNLDLLFQDTPPPEMGSGGLRNAIVGSLMINIMAIVVATPVGILAATFLAEYARKRAKKIATFIRFVNDIWLSAPSIIVGLFIYTVVVHPMGHYSAIAGALALALIAFPIITRASEDMLTLVPNELREAGTALGLPQWKVIVYIVWRAAKQGILTSILLATARISGETAPLLFTTLNNQFFSRDFFGPMANLPVTIYQFASSPYTNWQELAWGGAFLITVFVLFLNVMTRLLSSRIRKTSR